MVRNGVIQRSLELEIKIGNFTVILDAEDYIKFKDLRLGFSQGEGLNYYVHVISGPLKNTKLHRLIVNATAGDIVDHINGNTLDNRKNNLRICTPSQNSQNKKGWWYKDLPKGVSKSAYGFRARISPCKGVHKFLGTFSTVEEAKAAYDKAAEKYFEVTKK